jgi:hypothetical protein
MSALKENVYSTVCPGCNFGCGVYMRALATASADAPLLSIDYKKPSPVNEGKLCRFGVNLASFYTPAIPTIGKKETDKTDNKAAVNKAAEILKKADASKVCFLSVGGTTNEEHLAFMNAAKALALPVNTGMSGLFKDIGKLHAYTGRGTTYEDIENAKKIYLFVDPYVQYPLLVRRLIHAKNKGAEIISFGVKEFPIATQNVCLKPTGSLYDVKEFAPTAADECVVISDLTPYTGAKRLAEMVEIAGDSKMLFLKPFVNSTGAGYLSKHTKQKSFDDILAGIESGDIKVLVCLDSDLLDICLDENIAETLGNLDSLIVFASRQTSVCAAADVVIATEPFYKKKGSVMNAEGRLLQTTAATGDLPLTGFNALSDLAVSLGGTALDFDAVHAEVVAALGATEDEFKILPPVLKKEKPKIEKISDTLSNPDLKDNTMSCFDESAPAEDEMDKALHVYVTNPFLWNNVADDDDFIEICRCTVKSSKLLKGFTADVTCCCGEVIKTTRFKVSPMMCFCVLSTKKQPFAKAAVSEVTLRRTPTKPNEPEIVKEC